MKYTQIEPSKHLKSKIHNFWELKGEENDNHWERIFPDGCPGLLINLGDTCKTDNGHSIMEHGKTYLVGAMTSFKDSYMNENTHLVGICLKPSAFSSFFSYASLHEIKNQTIEFDKNLSFNKDKFFVKNYENYLNQFFIDREIRNENKILETIKHIQASNGTLSIERLSKRNDISIRQLERKFNETIGLTPKEFSNIIRVQHALDLIENSKHTRSLLDIAFECGFYDHSHLTNAIKQHTGRSPSNL